MASLDDLQSALRPRRGVDAPDGAMREEEREVRRMTAREPDQLSAGPSPAPLGELTRGVLLRVLRDPKRTFEADREVRAAMRQLCEAARADGLRAEQLLIALKEVWRTLPATRRSPLDEERETFARVVTLCIQEYYSPPDGGW
jgi:hypothetical protein